MPEAGPFVSFTFDDFPRSALHVGGEILKDYGARGTFYAAMGLMGKVNRMGPQFVEEDLEMLIRDGHELGSHTLSHVSCRSARFRDFEADAARGQEAVLRVLGAESRPPFAYPYGEPALVRKGKIGSRFSSCRGTAPGINRVPVDLNLLRANYLYDGALDLAATERLLRTNEEQRAWVVFYTHDVSETPSPFGCTPDQLRRVIGLVLKTGAGILPVGRVLGTGTARAAGCHQGDHQEPNDNQYSPACVRSV